MTKEQRAAINRANAQKSTGPKTDEGKAKSRRNAIKHGDRAEALKLMVPPHSACHCNEDRQSFYDLLDLNVGKLRPNDEKEVMIVREISDCEWEINRNQVLITAIHNAELMRQVGSLVPSHPDLADIEMAVAVETALAGNLTIRTLQKRTRDLRREITVLEKRLLMLKKHFASPTSKIASTDDDKAENLLIINDDTVEIAPNEPKRRQPNSTPGAIFDAIFGKTEVNVDTQ